MIQNHYRGLTASYSIKPSVREELAHFARAVAATAPPEPHMRGLSRPLVLPGRCRKFDEPASPAAPHADAIAVVREAGRCAQIVRGGNADADVASLPPTPGLLSRCHDRLVLFYVQLWCRYRDWLERGRVEAAWDAIDERTLRDIGVSRCEARCARRSETWGRCDYRF